MLDLIFFLRLTIRAVGLRNESVANVEIANGFVVEATFSGEVVEDLTFWARVLMLDAHNAFVIPVTIVLAWNKGFSTDWAIYGRYMWCCC